MSRPSDPPDPSSGSSHGEISAAAERAREQLRDEFQQLRVEIEELHPEEGGGDGQVAGGGFWNGARASVAVLALSAAVAAAAVNFGLNGGRAPKDGGVGVPPRLGEEEPGVITPGGPNAEIPSPLLSLLTPGLQIGTSGSSAGIPGTGFPSARPSPQFVVGEPAPVSGHGSPHQEVGGADLVAQPSPAPTAPAPTSNEPPQLAFSPPTPPVGPGGGSPGGGSGGGGKDPAEGEKPGKGTATAAKTGGRGKGHIKARGKGHGGSPGKGHEKDQGGGEVAWPGSHDDGGPGADPAAHDHGGGGGGSPASTAPPADPVPPGGGPGSGSNGKGGGKSEGHGGGDGKSSAPGQAAKQ